MRDRNSYRLATVYSNPFVDDGKGEVILVVANEWPDIATSVLHTLGETFGDYFGYSICVMDYGHDTNVEKCIYFYTINKIINLISYCRFGALWRPRKKRGDIYVLPARIHSKQRFY